MLESLIETTNDPILTVLRLALGIMIFPHGAQKVLGWFGGRGLKATVQGFQEYMAIPAPLAYMASFTEFFGGIALILGVFGRVAALGVGFVMLVAAIKVHLPHGFLLNWDGSKKGHGFEFHFLAIAIAVAIIAYGSGALSVDYLLSGRVY